MMNAWQLSTLVESMGLAPVAHMRGGYKAWVEAGGPTEEKEAKLPKPKN